jgi:hypothetical protein
MLVIALISGVLYGVGRFLLSNDLAVTRTVTIERPRVAVFAMVNDLRVAKEWSPFYARDPDAEYAFSGDPGEGQSMRWVSNVRDVGRGRMSIVSSAENQEVQAILELGDRATLNSLIDIRPGESATAVAWTMTAECGEGAINVPCRYMNLILRGRLQRLQDLGIEAGEVTAKSGERLARLFTPLVERRFQERGRLVECLQVFGEFTAGVAAQQRLPRLPVQQLRRATGAAAPELLGELQRRHEFQAQAGVEPIGGQPLRQPTTRHDDHPARPRRSVPQRFEQGRLQLEPGHALDQELPLHSP